jgi:hypothetical protein
MNNNFSNSIRTRITPDQKKAIKALAKLRGVKPAQICRDALFRYIRQHTVRNGNGGKLSLKAPRTT